MKMINKNDDNKYINPQEKLEEVIANMALNNNFWGYIFGRIRKNKSYNVPSIMGVGLNKKGALNLFYNPHLVLNTDQKNLRDVLEHEGLHILNLHISRLLRLTSVETDKFIIARKASIWGIAADCAVNEQQQIPKVLKINGSDWPAQYPEMHDLESGRSSESYFNTLYSRVKDQCPVCGNDHSSNDKGNSNNNESSEQGKDSSENNNNSKNKGNSNSSDRNEPSENGEDNSGSTKCPCCGKEHSGKNIDDHSEWGKAAEGNNPEDVARKVENQTRKIVKDSVKSFKSSQNRGNLPGYIQELIEELLDIPKIPYYQIIRSLIKGSRLAKWKKSYTRINKKRVYTFFDGNKYVSPLITPFPGKTKDFTFKIVILIDTSGSQSVEDLAEALSGSKDIIENDKYCLVTVLENDTQVNKEYEIKKVSDIDPNISGRGGTTLQPGIIRAKELNPDVMIGFTDGYCDDINNLPDQYIPKKCIWIISPNGSEEMLNKTGFVVYIDKDDN